MENTNLKNTYVVRFFISSPFNGMEKERDILTKFYWPKIESALSAKGLHLKLVDMRWGITHSSSTASQTVNICLKEIDRTDVFIGLFGQRYGWNSRNDPQLQDNFDKAAEKYPWVDHYRDRSVTEMEFLHGHLNKPGAMPACFCFRDKKYDDKMRKEAETQGDVRKERSYKSEDDHSYNKLQDLKSSINATEKQTLGVAMDYKIPQEAADFIYEKVWKYVEEQILAKIEKPMSEEEQVTWAHKAYQASQCGLHVGREKYFSMLDQYVNDNTKCTPLTVIGSTGSGKTSLVGNWIQEKNKTNDPNQSLFYHFVGAEPHSVEPKLIMVRMVDFLQKAIEGEGYNQSTSKKNIGELATMTSDVLLKAKSEEHTDKLFIMIVDSIDKVTRGKTSMPLFFLPQNLPNNVKLIVSLSDDGKDLDELMEVLNDLHQTKKLYMELLDESEKKQLCRHLLEDNSKSMEYEQLEMVTKSPKTNNPSFLKILINELCVSGRFRQLSRQINDLLESDGILGLLMNVITRAEEDYAREEYTGNVVKELLSAICLCQRGISESEFPIPQHILAPAVYAMKGFLTEVRGGFLVFSFSIMNKAVTEVYMSTEDDKHNVAKKVADIFYSIYQSSVKKDTKIEDRVAVELLHLLKLSNDKVTMREGLSDIRLFQSIYNFNTFQLNEYWQWLDTPAVAIANLYLRSLDCYIAEKHRIYLEQYKMDHWCEVTKKQSNMLQDLRTWFEDAKMFNGLPVLYDREFALESSRGGISLMKRKEYICVIKYQKACFLGNISNHDEAIKLHKEVIELRKELIEAKAMDKEDLSLSYHGLGVIYHGLKDYDEAEKWYKMSLDIEIVLEKKVCNLANTYCNLGLVEMGRNNLDTAIELFTKSNKMRLEVEPNVQSLEISYYYHNIGLAYRKKKNYDMAEVFYKKSLKIKENLLGKMANDVGISVMNLGSVELSRKNHDKSYEYAKRAVEIFRAVNPEGSPQTMMAQENMINVLTRLDRFKEAEPLYDTVFAYLLGTKGGLDSGLVTLARQMAKHYMKNDNYEKGAEIALALLKSSKCKPGDFVMLRSCDDNMSKDKRPDRSEEFTLDFGLNKHPEDRDILMLKCNSLISKSLEALLSFVDEFCEKAEEVEKRYALVADVILVENKEQVIAIRVLEEAVKEKPERTTLIKKLEEYKELKNKEKRQ